MDVLDTLPMDVDAVDSLLAQEIWFLLSLKGFLGQCTNSLQFSLRWKV